MAFRVLSLLVTLVVMGITASTLHSRLASTHRGTANTPETLLREAAMIVERTHQLSGTYAGVGMEDQSAALRLVSSDASGYCLQLTWINQQLYHLRGPGGQVAPGAC